MLRDGSLLFIADFTKGEVRWSETYFTPRQVRTMLRNAQFRDVHVKKVRGEHFMFASATK